MISKLRNASCGLQSARPLMGNSYRVSKPRSSSLFLRRASSKGQQDDSGLAQYSGAKRTVDNRAGSEVSTLQYDDLEEGKIREGCEPTETPSSSIPSSSTASSSVFPAFRPRAGFEIHDRTEYHPGMIIQTVCHTPAGPGSTHRDDVVAVTSRGPVYSKFRRFVVLEMHWSHFQALPLYTHNGTGLNNKRQQQHEFVCIRDRDVPKSEREPEEGVNGTVFGVRHGREPCVDGRTAVKLTESVSFVPRSTLARVEGRLEHESLRALARLVSDSRRVCLEHMLQQPPAKVAAEPEAETETARLQRENDKLRMDALARGAEEIESRMAGLRSESHRLRMEALALQARERSVSTSGGRKRADQRRRLNRRLGLLEAEFTWSRARASPRTVREDQSLRLENFTYRS
ncbi:hypothetical protein GGTG_00839 [Gaeumannomyces tritici R3-111a-1]|uniref:DUF6590 domain-containing protein n=1 Tax=Gaeumannomyces tritici (strain R3-111a-1) TaxID=644352 RepID=J3NHV3_GAET3|nr:hypothetical protein GGTG_00839 [Gaeumannomyces tritici R3-111a-1]EJT80846.1 hypothetical protein GGTG_00839 [Gaeumannomyces tritici R3-111a-1]